MPCIGPVGVGCGGGSPGGDWCGCDCYCCPPDGCHSYVGISFDCGSPNDPNDEVPFLGGCACLPPVSSFMMRPSTSLFDDDPKVTKPQKEDEIQALAECEIPCGGYLVTLTTTGCCFLVDGQTITHIGTGTVTANVSAEACAPTASVNGGGSSVAVGDCEGVSVSLSASEPCCDCCNPGTIVSTGFRMTSTRMVMENNVLVRMTKQGETSMKISKAALLKKIKAKAASRLRFKKSS